MQFSYTRFLYVDLMFYHFERNIGYLRQLVSISNFKSDIARTVKEIETNIFKSLIEGDVDVMFQEGMNYSLSLIYFMRAIQKLSNPLCKLIHQLESTSAKASWITPLYIAFLKDHASWEEKPTVKNCIDNDTLQKIKQTIT